MKPGITQVRMYSVPPTAAAAINHSLRGFPTKSKTAVRFPTPDFRHLGLRSSLGIFHFSRHMPLHRRHILTGDAYDLCVFS